MYLRQIGKIDRLFDVSVLTCTPAYEATSCTCRSFEEFKEKEAKELQEQLEKEKREAEEAEAKEQERLANYYAELKKEYMEYLKADK